MLTHAYKFGKRISGMLQSCTASDLRTQNLVALVGGIAPTTNLVCNLRHLVRPHHNDVCLRYATADIPGIWDHHIGNY